jgi:hypothetical protein
VAPNENKSRGELFKNIFGMYYLNISLLNDVDKRAYELYFKRLVDACDMYDNHEVLNMNNIIREMILKRDNTYVVVIHSMEHTVYNLDENNINLKVECMHQYTELQSEIKSFFNLHYPFTKVSDIEKKWMGFKAQKDSVLINNAIIYFEVNMKTSGKQLVFIPRLLFKRLTAVDKIIGLIKFTLSRKGTGDYEQLCDIYDTIVKKTLCEI